MFKINPNKHFILRCVLFSALFLTISFSTLWYHIVSYHGEMDERVAARQLALVESQQLYVHSTLQSVVKDTVFLLDMVYQSRIFDYLDQSSPDKQQKIVDFENMLLSFVERKGVYDQARYLDLSGTERIRVNYNNGKPAIVPPGNYRKKRSLLSSGNVNA